MLINKLVYKMSLNRLCNVRCFYKSFFTVFLFWISAKDVPTSASMVWRLIKSAMILSIHVSAPLTYYFDISNYLLPCWPQIAIEWIPRPLRSNHGRGRSYSIVNFSVLVLHFYYKHFLQLWFIMQICIVEFYLTLCLLMLHSSYELYLIKVYNGVE